MAPERPVFFEGQILAAADLTSAVDYGRAEVARHERYLHDWGIAEGLEMTTKPDATGKYVDVTLGAGVAIDGTGREIVVPQPVPLNTAHFFTANGASPQAKANYPDPAARNRHRRARTAADHRRLRGGQPVDPHAGGVRPDLRWPRRRASPG